MNVFAIELEIKDGVIQTPNTERVTVKDLSVAYVKYSGDETMKFNYNPPAIINRMVQTEDCGITEVCVPFCCTCDRVFLPPGCYTITACPLPRRLFEGVLEFDERLEIIIEKADADYVTAAKLNCVCGYCCE